MEFYGEPLANTMQALDFSISARRESAPVTSEPMALDLSLKSNIMPSSHRTIYCRSRPNAPFSSGNYPQASQFYGFERKSPLEGRMFMVTPPSESDSPKKIKYVPIYKCLNMSSNVINQPNDFPALPMTVPTTSTTSPTAVSTLPAQKNDTMPIPGTSATSMMPLNSLENDVEMTSEMGKKVQRPFKAYPKDPLSLSIGTAESLHDQNSNVAYTEFRKRMLESVKKSNENTNVKMKRVTKCPVGSTNNAVEERDEAYWQRRKKNNEAAKRSRDARRAKEDEIAIRAAFLEQENIKLKYEIMILRNEREKLRSIAYS